MPASATDAALVRQAQQGDLDAFNELLTRYQKKTYNLAFRLMGNHADACDAAQEAMVRIYTRLRDFRGDSLFSTWLFRLVTNTCLDELRRRQRQRVIYSDTPHLSGDGLTAREMAQPGPSLSELAEQKEVQALVHSALGTLSADYRTVIVLRDIQDLSYLEIAQTLGTTVGTIKSRLHRARHALRLAIQQVAHPASVPVA